MLKIGQSEDMLLKGLTNKNRQEYVRGTLLIIREGESAMAYKHTNSKGVTYYLNSKSVTLRGGKQQTIYYFSKDERPEATDLPGGFMVNENPRNGFLTVKRK
ncbi:MAG TPA: hypothetical protein VNE40_03120 [Candidatus Dormibacteraeota bacterium]|nr:hypothetical protein [Candidatus Dormibacteraeota bacterium]